ncbi:MAG: hypothetical protein KDD83_14165 [Caldilineaceae bacterium]|nr:hypothetical protein [Caldilineaceae bacterium]
MYFGWVTLGLMALIWHFLPGLTGRPRPRGVGVQMTATAVSALLSFPAFWINGYGTTAVGGADLPLGAMVSGLNGILWLVFAILYRQMTRGLPRRPLPIQLWDWAIVLLLVAFGGALGLVSIVVAGSGSLALQQLFLHLFLDLFAVGWFSLGVLGLLWAWIGEDAGLPRWLPSQSLALCIAPTFLLGISPVLVPDRLFWIAAVANLAAAAMLAWHVLALWQRRAYLPAMARFGLLLLAVHLVSALLVLWPGFWQWSGGTQLRVFYLHNFLLGWVSSALLGLVIVLQAASTATAIRMATAAWIGTSSVMLLALLSVGLVQIVPVSAIILLRIVAWSSIGPAVVALWVLGTFLTASFRRFHLRQTAAQHD